MAESNSQPQRCPCGFWGSSQTMGLCSKCYKEHQNKVEEVEGSNPANDKPTITANTFSKALSAVQPMEVSTTVSATNNVALSNGTKSNGENNAVVTEDNASSIDDDSKDGDTENQDAVASSSKDPAPGEKRENPDEESIDDRPPQKNKKRCFQCNCKLELAIRQLGKCRCDYVFCQLHRLPEQHDCIYDHKEKGRQAAREKMVSPKKHMGTSLKRIDSDS